MEHEQVPTPSGDIIDWTTFGQILEIDEDQVEREFSSAIVVKFFEQAEQTFQDMQDAIQNKDLLKLSQLGHFLKGSSAALGLTNVQNSCEKIQHLGARKDETGSTDVDDESEVLLNKIDETLKSVRTEYVQVKEYLVQYFGGALEKAANA